MQALFVTVAVAGLLYFLLAKRRFDFFSVAFISACVYFLPGFFGYVNHIVRKEWGNQIVDVYFHAELFPETYVVFTVVLVAIVLAGVVSDYIAKGRGPEVTLRGGENAALWAVALALVGFVTSVITAGDALLSADKIQVLEGVNSWQLLWSVGASLGAVLSFKQGRLRLFSFSIVLLLIHLYVGFRDAFALSVIAMFALWLAGKGRQRLIVQNWKIALLGGVSALFVFVYKQWYVQVKLGDWRQIAYQALGAINPITGTNIYTTAVTDSEPFVTQAILDKVLANHFYVGWGHLLDSVKLVIPFSRLLGGSARSFNDLFQSALFPRAQGGLANNIWAEMLSSGGWLLFALFVIFFISLLALGSYLLRAWDPVVAGGAALIFTYWAFYIHRNDLMFQISAEKSVLFLWAACVLFAMIGYELTNYLKGTGASREGSSGRSPWTTSGYLATGRFGSWISPRKGETPMRRAAFELGAIGGGLGVLAAPGWLLVIIISGDMGTIASEAGGVWLVLLGVGVLGVLGVIGLVGAALVRRNPVIAGVLQLVAGWCEFSVHYAVSATESDYPGYSRVGLVLLLSVVLLVVGAILSVVSRWRSELKRIN